MKKVVSDRRASLDEETEIKPTMRSLIQKEFSRGASIPVVSFPSDGTAVQDGPRLALVVMEPELEWLGNSHLRTQIAQWTKHRGQSPRLYPGSLVWCFKKPGRDLRDRVELWLAWRRVANEIAEGTLGGDFDRTDRAELQSKVADAEEAAKDEVWGGYRFAVIADSQEPDGLKAIDLGAGHSSGGETLCGRIITALKSQALLNESVGAGYIERNWPPALKEAGEWPIASLRQSFLNGALTRLLDPDMTLRSKVTEFVQRGDFGLASGRRPDGSFERIWFQELLSPEEVAFESGVFLLTKAKAQILRSGEVISPAVSGFPVVGATSPTGLVIETKSARTEAPTGTTEGVQTKTIRLVGAIPPEVWNRFGTKLLPKLRAGANVQAGIELSVTVSSDVAANLEAELRQVLEDLGLSDKVEIR